MKRSRRLALGSLIAAGGMSLTACDRRGEDAPSAEPPGAVDAFTYQTVPACKDKDEVPDQACDVAARNAVADDARTSQWSERAACEEVYAFGRCVAHPAPAGGVSWGPFVAGFVVAQAADGAWGGRAIYRDARADGYYTAGGGRVWRDYVSGRERIAARSLARSDAIRPPEPILTTSPIVSRRGFGRRLIAERWGG